MTSLNFIPGVSVFDANVRVGDLKDAPSPCRDRHQLLAEMGRHGVERALIYHAQAESISPIDGNRYQLPEVCAEPAQAAERAAWPRFQPHCRPDDVGVA